MTQQIINSNETMLQFYKQLGKIFYADAAFHNSVEEDKDKVAPLTKIIRSYWLKLDNTFAENGADSACLIEIVFGWLRGMNCDQALTEFQIFKSEHEQIFTQSIKFAVPKTANTVAESFSRKNKSELVFISQLLSIFSK